MDLGVSHHITFDLPNLSIHSEYNDCNDIIVGDGNNILIRHAGFVMLSTPKHLFAINNVLCAPHIKRNLL